jgi:triphosphoribosyl-dephospho-CoA synthase
MSVRSERVAAAFIEACLAELEAPKPGNVHRFAPGHRMSVADFARSAESSAGPIATTGARVGARVRAAVAATQAAVGQNTNLGIILLCAPLAAAAEIDAVPLRAAVERVLARLDRADAADVFAAIVEANPGGLGRANRHDVNAPATSTLREAMAEAADRDRIARQYVTAFEDVFSLGLPAFAAARLRQTDPRWQTLEVYLTYLAVLPDTHVQRNFDLGAAEATRREGAKMRDAYLAASDPAAMLPELLAWDAALKARGINPGTSADLTVATLFAASLTSMRPEDLAL